MIRGITVHKGTSVVAPIQAMHYDPKIWPEPEKFNPWRFTSEEKAKHSSYDWMPFGAGPRNCLAMRLALLEVKVALAHLVRKYKFVRSEKTEVNSLFCINKSHFLIFSMVLSLSVIDRGFLFGRGTNSKCPLLISEENKNMK